MERLCNPAQGASGLVLNFEARGLGPSYMLMETNGNGSLLKNLLQQTLLFQYQTH
jgi:hypothetical protein